MQPSANNISENLHASSQEGTSTEAGSATNHRPQPLRHLASIHPMHPRPEQQSALQRIGQLDQNLRGCSGQGVLDQVHTNAPLPETIVIPTVTRVTSTRLIPDATQGSELEELSPDTPLIDRELLMHEPESLESPQFEDERILVPPFTERERLTRSLSEPLLPHLLALRAIHRVLPSFSGRSPLHAQLVQQISSQNFNNAINHILTQLAQTSDHAQFQLVNLTLPTNNTTLMADEGFIHESVKLTFHAVFSPECLEPLTIQRTFTCPLSGHLFQVNLLNTTEYSDLSVSLNPVAFRDEIMSTNSTSSIENAGIAIPRGDEFDTLGTRLRNEPSEKFSKIDYLRNGQSERAIDDGGPLRECFTQAYEQALNLLMIDTPSQGGGKDIDGSLNIATINQRAVPLSNFGRLLAYVADEPLVNLAPHLFEQSFEAILTVANYSTALGIAGKNDPSDLLRSTTEALQTNKTLFIDIVGTLFPAIKTTLENQYNDPLAKYANSQETPPDAKETLSAHLSDHLQEALGLCYSPDTDKVTIAHDSSRFLQLALIADGFNAVREARTMSLVATYPTEIKALVTAIIGRGDLRGALSDPDHKRAFTLSDESKSIEQEDLDTFKNLIHQWASNASDAQLSLVCRAMTSSAVLPDYIGNNRNRLAIEIKDIPVTDDSDKVLGYADFSTHACYGTLDIAPKVVIEILKEHKENPDEISPRLERLLGEELPNESRGFNAE